MAKIRAKNTKPELMLRSALFKMGFRFRLHSKDLPGKPDLVFRKFRSVIFVHGCFWHLHEKCREGRIPSSRVEYWEPKLKKNVARDAEHYKKLCDFGWNVIVVWECELERNPEKVINEIKENLESHASYLS